MQTQAYMKPLPEPSPDTKPYWDALNEGRLVLQCCAACGKVRHYPRPVCPYCYSMEARWQPSPGRGKVVSWTVTHHAFHPGFKVELPYLLLTVELEEGVRMNAQARGITPGDVKIGLPVRVAFEAAAEGLTLPVFVREA